MPLKNITDAAIKSTRVASIAASKPNDTKVVTSFHSFAMLGFDDKNKKIRLYDPAKAKILSLSPSEFRQDFQAILFRI